MRCLFRNMTWVMGAAVMALHVDALAAEGAALSNKRVIGVDEALRISAAQSPDRLAAMHRADASRQIAYGSIGRMLPRLSVSDEYQRFADPFVVKFPAGPSTLAFTARNRGANSVTIAGAQPLLGLLHLNEDRAANLHSSKASGHDSEATARTIATQIKTLFLQLFEARSLADTAVASESTLNEQVSVADKKLAAGVLTKADVLRLQVAAANARQEEINARSQERRVRASLLEQLGLSADADSIEFAEPVALENIAAKAEMSPQVSRRLALEQRPEVLGMQQLVSAADHRARARWLGLLPEINLEAAWTHVTGQLLAPEYQLFIGVKADWAFWEWGATFFEARSLAASRDATLADYDRMQRQVGVEVADRQADGAAASSAITVSQLALQSAEEAFRVTQQENLAGSATTTDLLDAEAALTRARLNVVRATYDFAIAQVALDHAMGNP